MNYVAFILYGDKPRYLAGAVRNVLLVKEFYPGWTPLFYVDSTVPSGTLLRLVKEGAAIDRVRGIEFGCKRSRRFLVFDIEDCDLAITRDADSRIFEREKQAVDAWIASGLPCHVMRDHPKHSDPIMAGLFGARAKALRNLMGMSVHDLLESYSPPHGYERDQPMLADRLWPLIQEHCLHHDSIPDRFPGSVPFPTQPPEDGRFVGEIWDEFDQPKISDRCVATP